MTGVIGERATRAGRAASLAALGGVIGPVLFVILVVVAGVAYDGYSHVTHKISELGGEGADHAILQNVNFAIVGALILGFSWALARTIGPSYLGPALVGYFGLVLMVHARVPCDLGCRGETAIGLVHNATGLSAFIASIVGMLLLARRWRDDSTWRSHAGFTRGAASGAFASLVWFVITQAGDIESFAGIAQRTFVGALLLWVAVTAWKLRRHLDTSAIDVAAGAATAR